jgi:hypothetical protein
MPMTSDAPQTMARRSLWKGQSYRAIRMAETLPNEEDDEDDIDDEDIAEEDDDIDDEDIAEEEDEEEEA